MHSNNLKAIGTIQRALGLIEGAALACDEGVATLLGEAVQMIDESVDKIASANGEEDT